MKTLIIHPADHSTSFLDIVYNSIPDKTVITGGVTKSEIQRLIREHDRVMMMGHGSPGGLFSVGQFKYSGWRNSGYIIDQHCVPLLKQKKDNVFIWCHADKFVNLFGLKGFYSGMFISEVVEAVYEGLPNTKQETVDESNYGFVNIISKYINEPTGIIYENVRNEYGIIAEKNDVAEYNHMRLYAAE